MTEPRECEMWAVWLPRDECYVGQPCGFLLLDTEGIANEVMLSHRKFDHYCKAVRVRIVPVREVPRDAGSTTKNEKYHEDQALREEGRFDGLG